MTVLDMSDATIDGGLIPAGAFAGTALESVVFPAAGSITIGEAAFMGTSLTELVLPISIKRVDSGAFGACNNLKNVTIFGAALGDYAFHLCPELQWVELGLTETVGAHTFDGCTKLQKFTTEGALRAIGDYAFANTGLIVVRLDQCRNLSEVGGWAFANDPNLTVIAFPSKTTLGRGVLFNCPALRSISLPDNLTEIPDYAFMSSTGSNGYYTVPENVEVIGAFAYKDTDLGHIVLPSALKKIGTGAMESTSRLSIIDAGNVSEVPDLGDDVWQGVDKTTVQLLVPKDLTPEYKSALQWQDFRLDVSGVDSPENEFSGIRAALDGDNLLIESTGADILRVEIFNEAGATLLDRSCNASVLSIGVADLPGRLMLVRCSLDDGSAAILKLTH